MSGTPPGLRLVVGVTGDRRAWVQVANTLLARTVSGEVRCHAVVRVPVVPSGASMLRAVIPARPAARLATEDTR